MKYKQDTILEWLYLQMSRLTLKSVAIFLLQCLMTYLLGGCDMNIILCNLICTMAGTALLG